MDRSQLKDELWFKIPDTLTYLRRTGKADVNIKPEEYYSISKI